LNTKDRYWSSLGLFNRTSTSSYTLLAAQAHLLGALMTNSPALYTLLFQAAVDVDFKFSTDGNGFTWKPDK
jgi:hypothetical protein